MLSLCPSSTTPYNFPAWWCLFRVRAAARVPRLGWASSRAFAWPDIYICPLSLPLARAACIVGGVGAEGHPSASTRYHEDQVHVIGATNLSCNFLLSPSWAPCKGASVKKNIRRRTAKLHAQAPPSNPFNLPASGCHPRTSLTGAQLLRDNAPSTRPPPPPLLPCPKDGCSHESSRRRRNNTF